MSAAPVVRIPYGAFSSSVYYINKFMTYDPFCQIYHDGERVSLLRVFPVRGFSSSTFTFLQVDGAGSSLVVESHTP